MKRSILFTAVALALLAGCRDDSPTPVAPDRPDFLLTGTGTIPDQWNGGPLHGAIFTTLPFGQAVNANVQYTRKIEVYLDGGPRNPNSLAAGLNDGLYVFQITDPPGKYLLSQDPARCRVVQVKDGVILGTVPASRIEGLPATIGSTVTDNWSDKASDKRACHIETSETDGASLAGQHDTNVDSDLGGGYTVQMMPFGTTPNPGGVYKAWITPLAVYVQKAGGIGTLNTVPAALKGAAARSCPDFCATPDVGFKNPARNNVKTDNFKVKENPPFIQITKNVDGQPVTSWHVTAFELLEGEWNGKGWTDDLPATFAVPFGAELLACESVPSGYKFVSATVDGSAGVIATAGNTTPAPPTEDDQTPPNPIVCVKVGPIATSTTVAVVFNNHKIVPNAYITIEPDGVNEVAAKHTFKATAYVDPDETGWKPVDDGTVISFSTSGGGSFNPASKTCTTSGGSCTIELTNSSVGKDVVTATVTVIGLTRSTDGVAPNSGPATKRWVDAYIQITPKEATNAVGEQHTFSIAFTALPGDATPVTFNSIAVTLSSATLVNPTDYFVVSETCSDKTKWGGAGNTRTCQVDINSNKAGTIKAVAKGSVTMGADQDPAKLGATVLRETDGSLTPSGAQNSDPATKTYYVPAGCTPGFWKQEQHLGYWHDSPFSPVDPPGKSLVSDAFTHFNGQGGKDNGYNKYLTLIDALGLDNSNGIGQVLRHGTAALLNTYSKGVLFSFGDDPEAVKKLVNDALDAYDANDQTTVNEIQAKLAAANEKQCTLTGQIYW